MAIPATKESIIENSDFAIVNIQSSVAIPATKESIIENSGSSDFAIANSQSSVAIPATIEVQEDKLLLLAATAEVQEATSKKRKVSRFQRVLILIKEKESKLKWIQKMK